MITDSLYFVKSLNKSDTLERSDVKTTQTHQLSTITAYPEAGHDSLIKGSIIMIWWEPISLANQERDGQHTNQARHYIWSNQQDIISRKLDLIPL